MTAGDFYGNEQSARHRQAGTLRIEFVDADGATTVLKDGVTVRRATSSTALGDEPARAQAFFAEGRSTTRRPRACCCRCTSRRR